MNRKKKLILIGILAIFYIIIAVNFHKIRFAVSMLQLYNQERKVETVADDKDTSQVVIDNPLQDILDSLDDELITEEGIDDNPVNQVDEVDKVDAIDKLDDNSSTIKPYVPEAKNDDPKKSYADILGEYNSILEDLRHTFESELDELIQNGIKEYTSGNLSTTQLVNKYLSIGSNLEKSSDTRFNRVLKDMEKELKSNNHETTITKDIKDYYNSFKNRKKIDLINKGMKHVK